MAGTRLDGVTGVDDEIHEDPLEALEIETDAREPGLDLELQLDRVAGDAVEHAVEPSEGEGEIDGRVAARSLATVGEHLFDESCAADGSAPDLLERLSGGRVERALGPARQLELEQIRVADDHRQHVVQIVGRRARDAAEGSEALVVRPFGPQRHELPNEAIALEKARQQARRRFDRAIEIRRGRRGEKGSVEGDQRERSSVRAGTGNLQRRVDPRPAGRRGGARDGPEMAAREG